MTDAATKVTRAGQTLSARFWAYLEDSYRAAGLDPTTYLVVTQGAYKAGGGAAASGSTHDKAGAADLRTWNLPSSARANLCQTLVVELRRRGGCAWYRDEAHGGMDPHIHVILRGESPLSSGASSQVSDYDKARNGLADKGSDYHPRPPWHLYAYNPTPAPTPTTLEDDTVIMVKPADSNGVYLLSGPQLSLIADPKDRDALAKAGVPGPVTLTRATFDALAKAKD